jgi:dihydroorotase
LKVVFEHITTAEAAAYVNSSDKFTAATITPQHLLFNRNALFTGGLRPHYYCLPVLKKEQHRLALVRAATSGSSKFFLGSDSAPHAAVMKEQSVCGAGCFTAPTALELYAEAFEAAGALDKLEAFASFHGPDFYGLPRNTGHISLRREPWMVPVELPFGDATIKPLRAGETLHWRLQH